MPRYHHHAGARAIDDLSIPQNCRSLRTGGISISGDTCSTHTSGISKTKQTRRNWHIPSGKLVWGRWGPALCVLCLVYAGGGLVLGIVELASLSEADASITLQGSPLESLNLGQRTTHLSEVLTCSSRPPLNGDRPRVGSFHCSSF